MSQGVNFSMAERPARRALRGKYGAFCESVVATLTTNQAVLVDGVDALVMRRMWAAARVFLKRYHEGLRLRIRREAGSTYFWVEKKESNIAKIRATA